MCHRGLRWFFGSSRFGEPRIRRGSTPDNLWWARHVCRLGGKAAALGVSLVGNHPFVDGTKRIGHAALEIFLVLNGFELEVTADEQETVILGLAAGQWNREQFTTWVASHLQPME